MSRAQRRVLIERAEPALPVSQQCRLLAVSRASIYRQPAAVSEEERTIMALIDRQYLARPYYGSRRMAAWLATQGHVVNRKRVRRPMRLIGPVAIYQRPNTSKPAAARKIYPYLLWRHHDRTGQSGLVFGRHLHPNGQGLPLSGGHHGLGEPCRAGVAVDPASIEITSFGLGEDVDRVKRLAEMGVTRVVPMFPSEKADAVLPIVDRWTKIMRQVNG